MFKNLLSFWKGKDFLTEVLEEFKEMLNDTKNMFESVCEALIKGRRGPNLEERIYKVDKRVNLLEREIRKRIVEHLSIQPGVDVPVSLVLMSVVKDAERVGDYCKNLLEIVGLLNRPIERARFEALFGDIDKKILEEFDKTQKAFIESDEKTAKQILYLERGIVKSCDEIVKQLAKGDLPTNEAVCLTLLARYFKRVAAHLANIGSSVILPISDLDFFDEKLRREKGR
ncbi:MAG: PhoU domain-containing protein [Candidatus Omnitrophota bacterium]